MFHMMNEARIGVGTAATMLGMAGYTPAWTTPKTGRRAGPSVPARTPPSRR
jgi:hypothetical protein